VELLEIDIGKYGHYWRWWGVMTTVPSVMGDIIVAVESSSQRGPNNFPCYQSVGLSSTSVSRNYSIDLVSGYGYL
jgi:hypothetical protein